MTNTNNKNNIDTIVSETINTIIPTFLNKIFKKNKKVLDGVLQLLKEDEEIETSIKELVLSNIPQPVLKVAKVRKNKNTKPKDSNAPKKPKSAYLIYCQENRKGLKEMFPDILPKEILSKLGASWKEIKDEPESRAYVKKANEEKAKYEKEMSEYTPSEQYNKELSEYNEKPENMKTKIKKNKKVDPLKPKKPQTIFFKFSKEMRNKVKEENPDMKSEDVAVELGRLWKNEVSQEEKDEYKEIFKTEMIEYKKLIEEYNTKNPIVKTDEEQDEEKKVSKKKTVKQAKEEPEEPEEEKKVSKKKTVKQAKEEPEEPEEEKKVSKKKTVKQAKDKKVISDDDEDNIIVDDSDNDIYNIIVDDSDIENMNNNTDDEEIIYDSD